MHLKPFQVCTQAVGDRLFRLREGQSSYGDRSDLRDHNHTIAFHSHDVTAVQALFWNVPDMDRKGIERSDHIIGTHRGIGYWRKAGGLCVEEIISKLVQAAFDILEYRKLRKGFLD